MTDHIDPELGTSARSLLDAARPALGPDAEAARRMRTRIAASVGGGVGLATGAAAVKSGLAAKLAIVGVVAVIGGGAALFALTRASDPVDAPSVKFAVHAPRSPISDPPRPTSVGDDHVETLPPSPEQEMPAVDARKKPVSPTTTPATPATQPSLAREVEIVDRAMAALRGKDFRGALSAITTYTTETAGIGQLAQDAAAIEVEAACGLHAADGPARLAAFDRRYPSSAQHARLEEACK
ncbi:MAG: hypothetical protein NT062_33195 [Proteobacteria bacterium]|nr:hypothetical protein [Pseudomonadota bacterium]